MKNSAVLTTQNKILLVILATGIVLLIAAIALTTYNVVEARASLEAEPLVEADASAETSASGDDAGITQGSDQSVGYLQQPNDPVTYLEGNEPIEAPLPGITLPQAETESVESGPPPEGAAPLNAIDRTSCIPADAERQTASVIDVIDLDRLSVSIGEETFTVKYLGLDTNDLFAGVDKAITTANHSLIGENITLVKDIIDTDESGDLLRYVFTDEAFINQSFLEDGLATISTDMPDQACAEAFLEAEAAAQEDRVGTWERLDPENWQEWPIIPTIGQTAVDIYFRNLGGEGTDPNAFSIVGDCLSLADRFLQPIGASYFNLPEEKAYLQSTIDQFSGMWARQPATVVSGFVPASVFSSYFADPNRCGTHESPLHCEFRTNNPSIVFISIGTDQKPGSETDFEYYMRGIIEYSIEEGVLPIIVTKADPTTAEFPMNGLMAELADEYDIPLWNFWASVQQLPNTGLNPVTGIHLTADAYKIRRLAILEILNAVLTAAGQ